MASTVQYIVDKKGHKTSVVVPFEEWEAINNKYDKLLNKVKVLTGITDGIAEVQKSRKSGKKLQSLSDFLNENRG